jgi:hypothetical protein
MAETVINPKGQYLYIWPAQDSTVNPVFSWMKAGPRQRIMDAATGASTDITINLFGVTLTGVKTYAWSQVHYDVNGVKKTGYVRVGDYEVSTVQTPTNNTTEQTTLSAGIGWIGAGVLVLVFLGSMGGKKGKRKK